MRADPVKTRRQHRASPAAGFDCATAFQKISSDCMAGIRAHHRGACSGDAEAVHQIRIAITQLRAAVSFFAPIVVDAEWRRLKKEIAWLNATLGAIRDSDVMTEYASRMRYQAWTERMISGHLEQCRIRDHRRLVRCLRSVRFRHLIEAVSGWIRHGRWLVRWEQASRRKAAEPLKAYSERKLDRWRRRLIRRGRHLGTLEASRHHRLRIKTKRFRYMLEGLSKAGALRGRGELRRLHGRAKRLQQALGDLRDLQRFAGLAARSSPAEGGKRGKRRPPGYRRREQKRLNAAIEAYRSFKRAGAC